MNVLYSASLGPHEYHPLDKPKIWQGLSNLSTEIPLMRTGIVLEPITLYGVKAAATQG